MSDAAPFHDLMRRVRAGDSSAAEELFRRFEPQVRLEARLRLRDPRLRRLVDENDLCQSVMLSFFVRARLGQYEVADAGELRRLLAGMARNKVAAQARRHAAARRDFRRAEGLAGADVVPAGEASPSQVVAGEELLREFRARLTDEERRVADLRAEGREWAEVAEALGGTAEGRRVQLRRAVSRVSGELGLGAGDE
ncbi:MAG TPA: ECF-type sigma factor [Gemmataceae bacterium]|nr:ECF-type sigma factor [Gemmataceae bacterium]